ncbi:hypothetical protein HYFRA_00006076 [Hymenoscyphus fraxineus]|uniref:Uncharacterized protein n=1 Tax=Hymenoscyphus fraxineus TaxID=746836 RepID=A0A9N9KXK5_9HELO|nr:hypothetical protein HYFRA_00006076 [Hymenoscyphus fraxineus]
MFNNSTVSKPYHRKLNCKESDRLLSSWSYTPDHRLRGTRGSRTSIGGVGHDTTNIRGMQQALCTSRVTNEDPQRPHLVLLPASKQYCDTSRERALHP